MFKKEPPNLHIDVPNEHWLKNQIDYAILKNRDINGVPYMSKITGYFDKGVMVPVDILIKIPGMRNEQKKVRNHDLIAITRIMETTGKLPLMTNNQEYLPFICVAHNGECWVNEGNHRIMAASNLDWKFLEIEVRYFEGSESVDSLLSPDNIDKYHESYINQDRCLEISR